MSPELGDAITRDMSARRQVASTQRAGPVSSQCMTPGREAQGSRNNGIDPSSAAAAAAEQPPSPLRVTGVQRTWATQVDVLSSFLMIA